MNVFKDRECAICGAEATGFRYDRRAGIFGYFCDEHKGGDVGYE